MTIGVSIQASKCFKVRQRRRSSMGLVATGNLLEKAMGFHGEHMLT
jgi:hypothetical protein